MTEGLMGGQRKDAILSGDQKLRQLMLSATAVIKKNPDKYNKLITILREKPALSHLAARIEQLRTQKAPLGSGGGTPPASPVTPTQTSGNGAGPQRKRVCTVDSASSAAKRRKVDKTILLRAGLSSMKKPAGDSSAVTKEGKCAAHFLL